MLQNGLLNVEQLPVREVLAAVLASDHLLLIQLVFTQNMPIALRNRLNERGYPICLLHLNARMPVRFVKKSQPRRADVVVAIPVIRGG